MRAIGLLIIVAAACGKSAPKSAAAKQCADLAACQQACDHKEARACRELGKLRIAAKPVDLDGAATAYRAGCDGGDAVACASLALQVQDGRGVPWDLAKATELYQRACDGGAGVGCFNLALMYGEGTGGPRDRAKYDELMQRAIAGYEAQAKADPAWFVNLAFIYEQGMLGSAGPDHVKAVAADRAACDAGDSTGCASLALHELDGRGVTKDREGATARLERACTGGNGLACGILGRSLYEDANNVPPRAVELTAKGCDLGDAESCSVASALYALGRGTTPNETKAAEYGLRGCDLGNSSACYSTGDALRASDAQRAAELFERGCHIGLADACVARVKQMVAGEITGTPAEARSLLTRACDLGDPNACAVIRNPNNPNP